MMDDTQYRCLNVTVVDGDKDVVAERVFCDFNFSDLLVKIKFPIWENVTVLRAAT